MTTKPLSGKPGPGPHMMFFFRGEAVVVPVEKADQANHVDARQRGYRGPGLDSPKRNQMKSRSAAMRALIASHCSSLWLISPNTSE